MATSLAEQLQRLAVPQTSQLKQDKKRASLLFDPKEAASLKRETIYHIGLEGLQELILKNNAFQQFENTLFHITSKDYERSVQSEEANRKLNKNISKFLLLLSPYFLLNCSHKALEWLINRYMINEYNRDNLLMLIFPYHESNIFVRVLQLLKFKEHDDPFYFLQSLQKPGVHLPKQSLLNYAATNSGFLKFISKFILQLIKVHENPNILTVPFNFYCTIFVGVLEYTDKVSEDQITQMLPLLLAGLNSNIPDFTAATYVVTARLVAKTNLSQNLLNKFVDKISKVKIPGLKTEACLVLLVLYQSQKEYKEMPPDAVANLSEKDWLPKILQELNMAGCFIYPFLEVLLKSATQEGINNDMKLSRDLVRSILDQTKLDDDFITTFIHSFLDQVKPKGKYNDTTKQWLTETLQTVERQYPGPFDKEIYKIFSDNQSKKRKKVLQKILQDMTSYKGKFEIFEKLYHPNKELRGAAVKYLKTQYNSLKDVDKEIIKSAFVDRLNDDSAQVVKETLKIVTNTSIIDEHVLNKILIQLVMKCVVNKESEWQNLSSTLLNSLCNNNTFQWEIFLAVFPYLLPKSPEELNEAKKLLNMPIFRECSLFKKYINKIYNAENHETFTKMLFESLDSNSNLVHVKEFLNTLKNSKESSPLHRYVSSLILTHILPKNLTPKDGLDVLNILAAFYKQSAVKSMKIKSSVAEYIESALKNKFPMSGYLKCLEVVINKTNKPEYDLGKSDFTDSNNDFFVLLTSILISSSKTGRKHFDNFLTYFFGDLKSKVEFLLNLCISGNPNFDSKCRENSLLYVLECLKDADGVESLILTNNFIVIYLIILLRDPEEVIRNYSFDILEVLSKVSKQPESFGSLIKGLLTYKNEVLTDHEQIELSLGKLFEQVNSKAKRGTKELSNTQDVLFRIIKDKKNPLYIKSSLLNVLCRVNSTEILEGLSTVTLDIIANSPDKISGFESVICSKIIDRIQEDVVNASIDLDSNIIELVKTTLKYDKLLIEIDQENKVSLSALTLTKLTRTVFDLLKENVKAALLDIICEVTTLTQVPEVHSAANRLFKHIDLDANLILDQLVNMREAKSPKQDPSKKKRIRTIQTVDILDTLDWKKGVTVLEFIQDKKKIKNTDSLLPVLFDILKKCLDFEEQAAVEYPKQLVLSLILLCCTKTEKAALPENVFNMELIVQSIRASQNPQTHHHALLVLAHTAQLVPYQVLHHIMAIFTFMGSSLLRHDDSYSFQIIAKIIDMVIPVLIKDNTDHNIIEISKVLRVFVDAMLDIPEHRRIALYKLLLNKIGIKENLYLFLLLVFEAHVLQKQKSSKNLGQTLNRLDIATRLCLEFTPEIVINNCIKLIEHTKSMPDEKQNGMDIDGETAVLNTKSYTAKQFLHYKYILLTYISNLLSSKDFVTQVACLKEDEVLKLEELYKNIIISILTYIRRASKVAEKVENTTQEHYWKAVLHHSYDILDSVNALLTSQMFLLVVKGLMVHNLSTVKRRALELLNAKLQHNINFFDDCDRNEIFALISPLVSIIETVKNDHLESDQELLIQTALLSLKLLAKSLAQEDPKRFVQLLEFVTGLLKFRGIEGNILASVILCLAELCVDLRAYAISCLTDFMPPILKVLKSQRNQDTNLLLLSVITALQKLLDSLPLFLSPYMEKILIEVSILLSKWSDDANDQKVQPFVNKLSNVRQKIGSSIPPRVLIPAVEESYNFLTENKLFPAVSALMGILAENLKNLKGPEINDNLPELTNFFLKALQFRSDGVSTTEEANIVESHILKAFSALILKLSESSFRPLYYKLYDWAVRNEQKSERLITFYNMSSQIAESLKGLFVLFAGHFVHNAAQTLDAVNPTKTEELYFKNENNNIVLLECILKTLTAVFVYDNQKFVHKERFEVLMQPLVDQLDNTVGGPENLKTRNVKLLTPCLVQFTLAVGDDSLWKQMNYQILLKMRSSLPEVRLSALHCLTEIVTKLGEDFLTLLPETIPFLAELLEDEDETVEKACQKAVQEMEKVLGEPLQKYF